MRNRQDEPIQLDDYDCPELQEITSSIEEMDRKINSQIHDLENDKQMKQLFFSNASHELKTPLTSIQGYAELLKQDELTEAMRADCIDRILLESRRMTRLIQDILMISRLESNEHNGPAEIVEMQDVVQSIVKSLTPLANEKQLTITTMLKPVRVYAYKPYMEELVSNLVHNAVLYNVPRGTIHIHLSAKEENMHLTVVDTGIGIAEDEQEKVFQRFYRADTNTKKGTGLGLSIVKHIALFYDGEVRIRSVLGKGTTLSVRFQSCIIKRMIKTILFDLDGTLLPMDQEQFVELYFQKLAAKMAYAFDSRQLIRSIWAATEAMIKDQGPERNERVFWKKMEEMYGESILEYVPVFERFYEQEFQEIQKVCPANPESQKIVEALKRNTG